MDRDKVVRHLNYGARPGEPSLESRASDAEIVSAIKARSDAPRQLSVFFLQANMEGLIASIDACAPGMWPVEVADARAKLRVARDFVLTAIATRPMEAVRGCLRRQQPGLDGLAKAISDVLSATALT